MNELATKLLSLSNQIAESNRNDEHRTAVLAQLTFANRIFEGIIAVCEKGNGLSAETLLRTLLEALSSMVVLAKHPEKLNDFVEHGRMTELRMLRMIQVAPLKARLEDIIKATEPEFQRLWDKFNERPWHGLGTKESFAHAEFGPDIYNRYYRRASAIAHGQPYVTVWEGKVRARPTAWKNLSTGAENMAMLMLCTSLTILDRQLKLDVGNDLAKVQAPLDAHLMQHMNQIEKLTGASD
jgi:hypothetical protein